MAADKTKLVILPGRRKLKNLHCRKGGVDIKRNDSIKYLGVWYDKDMRMTIYLVKALTKAKRAFNKLSRLMPNIGEPGSNTRILLCSVAYSKLLYGVPAWKRALGHKKYEAMGESFQKRFAI